MALLIWLLCLTVGGSFAFQCGERKKCDDGTLREMIELDFFPNKEQLSRLCPKFLEFFDCYFAEVEKCILLSIPELAKTGHEFASQLLAARNFTVDLCNENSTLHNDYVSNIDCILGVTTPKSLLYEEEAWKSVIIFFEYKEQFQTIGMDKENIMDTLFCLEYGFIITSLAQDINKDCGKRARELYLTILDLSNVDKPVDCSTESILSLKREFLDFQKLEDDSEDYWSIFQIVRR
ncbi:uncharacterized protein LOC129984518 [Argiope bruennichi]|uniref:uncharacterized protein LOC129984518 n=1 Tax=Argiope bruennichi TaxID=94029 RepID=UPI0024950AD9|nr:uncharacterized protein LOC129984518 [Argiope bruennichi]